MIILRLPRITIMQKTGIRDSGRLKAAGATNRPAGATQILFPGTCDGTRPISDNTLNAALRRLVTPRIWRQARGFRETASTLMNESVMASAIAARE